MNDDKYVDCPIIFYIIEEMVAICNEIGMDKSVSHRLRSMSFLVASQLMKNPTSVSRRDLYLMDGMHHVEMYLGQSGMDTHSRFNINNAKNRLMSLAVDRVNRKIHAACVSILES